MKGVSDQRLAVHVRCAAQQIDQRLLMSSPTASQCLLSGGPVKGPKSEQKPFTPTPPRYTPPMDSRAPRKTKIGHTLFGKPPAPEIAAMVEPFDPRPLGSGGASTDVGDVSWTVPT